MLSKKEVEKIANLARIGLSEEELERYRKDLSEILDYVAKLKEVNVDNIEPTSHSVTINNVLRQDKVQIESSEVIEAMLEQAPDTNEGFIKTKAIL